MSSHTLVLTPWMTPHKVVPWTTAIVMLFTGKIEILEEYDEVVRSPSIELHVPCVARLKRAVSTHKRGVKFSRINVMTRDGFTCQYCGTKLPMKDLNYDHVIPRNQGGRTVWENIVTACYPCNHRKAGRTPEQAKMKLIRHPTRPKSLPMTPPLVPRNDMPEAWRFYLGESLAALTG